MAAVNRRSTENPEIFKKRRQKVIAGLKDAALIVANHPEHIRNDDVHYAYRPDSNFYYLSGFEEPESILILRPGKTPESVLFCRQKNIERETWDGFRFGPAAAQKEFLFDEAHPIEEFEKMAVELLKGYEEVFYRLFKNPEVDTKIQNVLLNLKKAYGRSGYG